MSEETMQQALAQTKVEDPSVIKDKFDYEVPVEEDIKRAWRRGLTAKQISKRFGGSKPFIYQLCRGLKRKNDISKNDIFIVKDYSKDKTKFFPKKD